MRSQDEYRDEPGSVIEVDFYNATPLLRLDDAAVLDRVLNTYLAGSVPAFRGCKILDSSVLR